MFISQVDDLDNAQKTGVQVRDLDSLSDWLQDCLCEHKSSGSQNNKKDDGNSRFFHALKPTHFFSPHFVPVKKTTVATRKMQAPLTDETTLASGFCTLPYLPPKA